MPCRACLCHPVYRGQIKFHATDHRNGGDRSSDPAVAIIESYALWIPTTPRSHIQTCTDPTQLALEWLIEHPLDTIEYTATILNTEQTTTCLSSIFNLDATLRILQKFSTYSDLPNTPQGHQTAYVAPLGPLINIWDGFWHCTPWRLSSTSFSETVPPTKRQYKRLSPRRIQHTSHYTGYCCVSTTTTATTTRISVGHL